MMMKHVFYRLALGVCSVMVLCTLGSCSSELPYDEALGDGSFSGNESGVDSDSSFVISYSVEKDNGSRAGNSSSSVQSLHYYVYEKSTGKLVKKRLVRGVKDAVWPIRRENMSWELRQDLQDTLKCGVGYRILFIANADSSLFNKKADGSFQHIITDDGTYEEARLHLPEESLGEDKMFFMCEEEIPSTLSEGEVKKFNRISLRHVVSKTEFHRIPAFTDEALYEAFAKESKLSDLLFTKVNKKLNEFCIVLQKQVIDVIISSNWPFDGKDGEGSQLKQFLENDENKKRICEELKKKLFPDYIKQVKAENQLSDWNTLSKATVRYSADGIYNVLGFDRTVYAVPSEQGGKECHYTMNDGRFSIIGFTCQDETDKKNTIESVTMGSDAISDFVLGNRPFHISQQLNTWYDVECNPIDSLGLKDNYAQLTEAKTVVVNIDSLFQNDLIGGKKWTEFMKTKETANGIVYVFDEYIQKYVFKKLRWDFNFSNFEFTIDKLPTLDMKNNFSYYPSWTSVQK